MKLFLKQNWSEQFIYKDETPGFFVGRKQEIRSLKSIIKNNNSSTILISSVRGVGKSSFVHKALSEIDNIFPVFINIGHTLSNDAIEKEKKQILVSLIRATYFNKELRSKLSDENKLKELYEKSTGTYYIEQKKGNKQESTTRISLKMNLDIKTKDIVSFASIIMGFILGIAGIVINNPIFSGIGIFGFLFSVLIYKEKTWHSFSQKEEGGRIDDTTEYLEIEFENWLKLQKNNNLTMVFVIDELDKLRIQSNKETLDIIKEYKNLFTRSFAHFIFIDDQKAFDLVNEDREDEKKGIFPTFFTHIFYLSLPKTDEIKLYLNEIFDMQKKSDEKEKNELMNYLLFRSGNDFFDLKRLIADVISFNEDEKPFIDTDKIKNSDILFPKISELFGYVDKFFLKRKLKELKRYWKDNSQLQKEVFKFLNQHFNLNFDSEEYKEKETVLKLISFLNDIGTIEKKDRTEEDNTNHLWTKKYKRNVGALLQETDKEFNKSFKELIKVANDLDDLPKSYKDNIFEEQNAVYENRDGQNLSGINLYSTFSDYKGLFKALKYSVSRITTTNEKVKKAKKIIDEQIDNIFVKYFEIFTNLLDKFILTEIPNLFPEREINQRPQIFTSCPNFQQIFTSITHKIFGKIDNTRSVIIVKDFSDFDSIHEGLKSLIEQKNILVINIKKSKENKQKPIEIEIDYQDKIGRNRKKKIKVENFINFSFNNFRQFSNILSIIKNHLSE